MDGLSCLGWGDTLHRGNVLHFHPQHIPGMDAPGLRWREGGKSLIEPPEQFGAEPTVLHDPEKVAQRAKFKTGTAEKTSTAPAS